MTALVLDWDGTITERDSLHMVVEQFGDPAVFDRMSELLDTLTLEEVIVAEIETIRAPLDEVAAWARDHVRVRSGFGELVRAHEPRIVSAGFHELIEPVLTREGVVARVVANRLEPRSDGWRPRFRDKPVCPVCGERCKRGDLDLSEPFVYAGDGLSDRCVALAADRVFARAGLARWLDAQGVRYEPFGDLHEIRVALATG